MKIKWLLLAMSAAVLASGCAPTVYPSAYEPVPDPVHCKAGRQCEAEWVAAQEAVESASFMKLRMVTDTRLETYPEATSGRMQGTVTKFPAPDGSYVIAAQFTCYTLPGCDSAQALINFTAHIKYAGLGF